MHLRSTSLLLTLSLMACTGCRPHPAASTEPSARPAASSAAPAAAQPVNSAAAPSAAVPARPSGPVRFTDVTDTAGIHFRHNSGAFGKKYLPETMGAGVCAIDYDGDGWQDLFFVNGADWPDHKQHRTTGALYRNNHDGTFTDVTASSGLGVELYGMGCAVGDFDNDGRDDLYVTAVGTSHLFHNAGEGRFADVTARASVGSPGFATGAVWFDYDNDGRLDLFVAHYVQWSPATDQFCSLNGKDKSYCTPEAYKGESATLFHNLGSGRFEDVSKKAGLQDPTAKSLGIALLDVDNDGWLDLLVTNDTQPNKLYRNNHDGTFTDQAFSAGVAFSDAGKARAGMGTDVADWDASGHPGLVIGNFTNEGLALYASQGPGLFADQATGAGVAAPSAPLLTFSAFFFDYDLDGLPDIFAANGHVADDVSTTQPTVHYAEPALMFRNHGGGRFENATDKLGPALRKAVVARGAAYLDFDNDGDLDLVETTSNGPARLLRNDNGNANDLLRIHTVGVQSNRDGIGARIVVRTTAGQRLSAMVKSGSSYLSQSQLPATFGLGRNAKPVTVEITWPRGKHEVIPNVAPNQSITLREGSGMVAAEPIVFAR